MGARSELTTQGNHHADPEVAILVEGGEAVVITTEVSNEEVVAIVDWLWIN